MPEVFETTDPLIWAWMAVAISVEVRMSVVYRSAMARGARGDGHTPVSIITLPLVVSFAPIIDLVPTEIPSREKPLWISRVGNRTWEPTSIKS